MFLCHKVVGHFTDLAKETIPSETEYVSLNIFQITKPKYSEISSKIVKFEIQNLSNNDNDKIMAIMIMTTIMITIMK